MSPETLALWEVPAILLGLLLIAVVFPIWAVILCLFSKSLSKGGRLFWTLVIITTLPLGACAFGLFKSQKRFFQIISGIVGAVLLFFMYAMIQTWLWDKNETKKVEAEIASTLSRLGQIKTSGISRPEIIIIQDDMKILHNEVQKNRQMGFRAREAAQSLAKSLSALIKDDELNTNEYQFWTTQFESRKKNFPTLLE